MVYGSQENLIWLNYENEGGFDCDDGTNPYLEFKLENFNNPYQFGMAFINNVKVIFAPVLLRCYCLDPV